MVYMIMIIMIMSNIGVNKKYWCGNVILTDGIAAT